MSSPRILVVDDDAFALTVMSAAFEKLGAPAPLQAANGREALERLDADGGIDMVVSDIYMPEMDGIELLQGLAKRNFVGPVVMITGVESTESGDAPVVAGADDGELMLAPGVAPATLNVVGVLAKPVGVEDIRAVLAETGLLD